MYLFWKKDYFGNTPLESKDEMHDLSPLGVTLSGETLSGETFVGQNYSSGEIFVTERKIRHFRPRKSFAQ